MVGETRLTSWLHLVQLADESLNNSRVVRERLGLALRRHWKAINVRTLYTHIEENTMTEEDEAFNEIERRSKVKQDILKHTSKEAMLTAEVAVLTEMVRVLSDKIAEMEKNT